MMKDKVFVHYYKCSNDDYEAHIEEKDSDCSFVYFKTSSTSTAEFVIEYKTGYGPSIHVPDFTILPEEEVFQTSLIWDEPYTVHFLLAAQKFLKFNIKKWHGYKSFEMILEY